MMDGTGPVPGRDRIRVLITGANGFVGRHLIAALLSGIDSASGDQSLQIYAGTHSMVDHASLMRQIGLDSGVEVDAGDCLRPTMLDVCEPIGLAATVLQIKPHQVYHLAARTSGADTDRDAVMAVNAEGTRNLLDAVSELAVAPRVLLTSTGYVYGNTDPDRPATEDDPVVSSGRFGAYTDSKLSVEAIARQYRGLAVVVRAFAHTGPGQEPNFAVPGFARQLALIEAGHRPADLYVGNVDAMRDILDVRDVVRAYILLMGSAAPGETYNVALGRPISIADILNLLRSLATIETRLVTDPARLRPADIACSTGNPTKLVARTGWHARISIAKTLSDTLEYWRRRIAIERSA